MAISDKLPDGYTQIQTWPFEDVVHANELLDALEGADAKRLAAQRRASRKAVREARNGAT